MSVSTKRGGTVQHGVLPPPGGNNCVVHGNGIEKKPLKQRIPAILYKLSLPLPKIYHIKLWVMVTLLLIGIRWQKYCYLFFKLIYFLFSECF